MLLNADGMMSWDPVLTGRRRRISGRTGEQDDY